MKRKIAMLMAAMATSAALATSYTWTGGGTDATSWNDEDNWDPTGVPGGGDTATFTSAATIADGIVVSSGELKIYANGAAVTINGVISGAGSMYFQLPNAGTTGSKIALSGANTYSGGTTVDAFNHDTANNPQTYGVWLENATAFGSNRAVLHKGGTLNFNCANATFAYDFTPSTRSVRYNAMSPTTIDGYIADDTFSDEMFFFCKTDSAKITVTGKVGGTKTSHVNVRSRKPNENLALTFESGIVTRLNIRPDIYGDGYSGGITALGAPTRAAVIACAYNSYRMLEDDVLDENVLVDFTGYSDSTRGIDLNGTRQTVNRIQSQFTAYSANCRQIYSTANATLVIRPSQSSLANMSAINGAVSVVLDAQEPSHVQQFSNRVSSTTGSITASNGVFRIGANATFPNVPKIAAVGDGAIEVTSEVFAALAGVREIVAEGNGRVSLPGAALTATAVAVTLDETATLEITDGSSLEVASLKIGTRTYAPGNYPDGTFTQISGAPLIVANSVSPDSTGVWTGGGETEGTYDANNWEGGYPGEIPITFATGGALAILDGSLIASELKFDTPQATPTFTIATSANAPSSTIVLSGDIVMTNAAHASGHTNVVSTPIAFSTTAANIKIDGAANGLVIDGPIVQQGESLALTRNGTGTLYLNATNAVRTAGSASFTGGTTYLTGGALGGTAASPLSVDINSTSSPVTFYFNGGTFNQKFTVTRSQGNLNVPTFRAGTTNVVNGLYRAQNNYSLSTILEGNSHTTFTGGYEETWVWGYALDTVLYRGAVMEIRGNPLKAINTSSSIATRFNAHSDGGSGDYAKVVFAATGNTSTNGLYFGGPMSIAFETDFAFDHNSGGVATPIGLMRVSNADDYLKPTVVDLNGHSQRFGSLQTPPTGSDIWGWNAYWGHSEASYFTSETPATLYVVQNGRTNAVDRPWQATFRGAMSLVKEGTNTLTLAGSSTMSGRLEVTNGRLDFSGKGAMTNVSEFAVSGGVLAIDNMSRLPRRADCRLSGGKLDLAEDVTVNVHMLYVTDGADGWTEMPVGVYSAANLPAYISGAGSLRVRGDGIGTIMTVR